MSSSSSSGSTRGSFFVPGSGVVILSALAFPWLAAPAQAMLLVRYQTANVPTLAPAEVNPAVTATDMTAGSGLQLNTGGTFNWNSWDTASTTYDEAVAADDFWTWGFEVTAANVAITPTSFDIRLDRSSTGPGDFEIRAAVNNGVPVSLLSYSFGGGTIGVDFTNVSWSALGMLNPGDEVVFTLAAFGSTSPAGTFDLETIDSNIGGNVSLQLNADISDIADIPSVPAPLPLFGAAIAFGTSRRLRKRMGARLIS